MTKNSTIERAFRGYFAGGELPEVDLSAAKREVALARARRRRRRGALIAALSAACLALVLVFSFVLLPALLPHSYSIASAEERSLAYSDLQTEYAKEARLFAPFSLSANTSAEYAVYSLDGKAVLLEARLGIASGFTRLKAVVRVDLTDGKYRPEELDGYRRLSSEQTDYRYETEYVNGEYVSRAYAEQEGRTLFVDVSSQSDSALGFLMDTIL